MVWFWLFLSMFESVLAGWNVSQKKYGWATYWALTALGSWMMWSLRLILEVIRS